jgi:hypothetical protein
MPAIAPGKQVARIRRIIKDFHLRARAPSRADEAIESPDLVNWFYNDDGTVTRGYIASYFGRLAAATPWKAQLSLRAGKPFQRAASNQSERHQGYSGWFGHGILQIFNRPIRED